MGRRAHGLEGRALRRVGRMVGLVRASEMAHDQLQVEAFEGSRIIADLFDLGS
jgi:hypothetical protein